MVNEGDKVLINGTEYTLGSRLPGGIGAEGQIFNVEGWPNYVIKIINDSKMTRFQRNETYNHLKWLYSIGSRSESLKKVLTVPRALLDDHLGYIMRKAVDFEAIKKYTKVPEDMNDFDDWFKNRYTLKKRYQIIINMFRALRELHINGLVFTDLSPNNIMVDKTRNRIVFIDTDNVRNRMDPYLGVLGTDGYIAPEVRRKPNVELAEKNNIDPKILSNCGRITPESDVFSAAVIAFELLTLQHPFVGDIVEEGEAELEEAALNIETDYILKEGTENISTRNLVPQFKSLVTPEIAKLFYRTFVDGKLDPSLRPDDIEFQEAFENALDKIVECPDCGYSKIYSFDNHNECINCGRNLGPKIVLVMYNVFAQLNRADLINSIGDYPDLNIDIENLKDENGKEPLNFEEISRIVLEPGENNTKYLYLRHFEKTNERQEVYAKVTLSEVKTLKIEIAKNYFENAYLVERPNMQRNAMEKHIPLGKGKEGIQFDKYGIVFETKKQGTGFIKIFCKFIEC